MEAITAFNFLPRPQRRPLSFKLFPVRLIALTLAMTLTTLIVCARQLAQYAPRPSSPFASFADIFPGKPADTIKARGFFCMMIPYAGQTDDPDHYCVLDMETGSISEIIVNVAQQTIHQTQFTLREDLFKLGDLSLCLGTPKNRQNSHTVDFVWRGSGVFASAESDRGHFDPLIPLSTVSFTDSPSSGIEALEACLQNAR